MGCSIDLISNKTNCTCSTLFFLISKKKKTNLHVQHAFFLSQLLLFCTTTTLFCRAKTSNFLVLSPVFIFAFVFHCRSFSPSGPLAFLILSPPLWSFMFFFLQHSSLLFSVTHSSSFSVIHVSVNNKITSKKTRLCCCFFFLKVRAAIPFLSK